MPRRGTAQPLGQKLERRAVTRAKQAEVTTVEGQHTSDVEALGKRDNHTVHESDAGGRILLKDLGRARQVSGDYRH